MVRENPLWQQDNTYPARLDRQFIEDVFDTEGVIRTTVPGALAVSQRAAGANMSVDVAAGRAVIKGDDEANQGSYRVISTAVENLPIGAAPGSNSRIDLVVARVRDANVTGGVSSDWILEVIPGVVAASPVAPAVPNTAIPLAQVLVAAGTPSITTGMITDRRATAQTAAYLAKAQNLADLPDKAAARTALGVSSAASMAQVHDYIGIDEGTTSTAYTDLATIGPTKEFVCPASGGVTILLSSLLRNNLGGTTGAVMSFELYDVTAAGVNLAPDDTRAVLANSNQPRDDTSTVFVPVAALTPGRTYRARAKYKAVGGGTALFKYRRLLVIPTP